MGRRFLLTNVSGAKLSVPVIDIQDGDRKETLTHLAIGGTAETEEVLSSHEAAVTASKLTIADQGFETPLAGDATKADKDSVPVVADAVGTAVADASDLATAEALVNDLKAKYNATVALVNELKLIVNNMND